MVGLRCLNITWEASWKPLWLSDLITDNYKDFPWQASGRKCRGGRCSQGLRTPWWVVLSHITAFIALRLHLLVSFSEALGRGLLQMPLSEGRRGNLKDTPPHAPIPDSIKLLESFVWAPSTERWPSHLCRSTWPLPSIPCRGNGTGTLAPSLILDPCLYHSS